MKKILYLSFYFEPDLCAGSFRNSPLARELAKQVKDIAHIDVITTVPNRYSSFSIEAPETEQSDNLLIRRIHLPVHKSGFLDQVNAFRHYYFSVQKLVSSGKYDMVYASSSRLFTAFLGYRIAKSKKLPLYLDIRDIFTDTLNDVIPNRVVKFALLPLLVTIERRVFNYARHINLISKGFQSYFKKYKNPEYTYFTNGIDKEFIQQDNYNNMLSVSPIVITYAGNIGEGQGLHKIIPQAAKQLGNGYLFRIIGDGGAKHLLETAVRLENLQNVVLEKPVKRDALLNIYKQSHFLFMHLNDYKAFEKVLPSKVFELGAFPRPVIAGVNGYANEFIKTNVSDCILFMPTDAHDMVKKIREYPYHLPDRLNFIKKYNRDIINQEMARSIASYL